LQYERIDVRIKEELPMAKQNAGLHKEVREIFEGVPIPRKNGSPRPNHLVEGHKSSQLSFLQPTRLSPHKEIRCKQESPPDARPSPKPTGPSQSKIVSIIRAFKGLRQRFFNGSDNAV
jgi:hypothetical protein